VSEKDGVACSVVFIGCGNSCCGFVVVQTDYQVRLGRVDSATAGAAGRISAAGATVAEITAFRRTSE
jgi:hypothetical protein